MLTPEQFKKLIEIAKPEGFIVIDRSIINTELLFLEMPCGKDIGFDRLINNELFELVYHPLFLQKCLEGINKIEGYFAQQMKDCIIVIMEINDSIIDSTDYDFKDYNSIDQAKEQALIYILENIK